jgi:proteic killer suppression protein
MEIDPHYRAPFPLAVVKAYAKRIWQLRAAADERDLNGNKGLHFEKYYAIPGQHSIRLNNQYRLIVELEGDAPNKTVVITKVTDYH